MFIDRPQRAETSVSERLHVSMIPRNHRKTCCSFILRPLARPARHPCAHGRLRLVGRQARWLGRWVHPGVLPRPPRAWGRETRAACASRVIPFHLRHPARFVNGKRRERSLMPRRAPSQPRRNLVDWGCSHEEDGHGRADHDGSRGGAVLAGGCRAEFGTRPYREAWLLFASSRRVWLFEQPHDVLRRHDEPNVHVLIAPVASGCTS